jgi:hypothetical protein
VEKIIINQPDEFKLQLTGDIEGLINKPRIVLRFREFFEIIEISKSMILLQSENLKNVKILHSRIESIQSWFDSKFEISLSNDIQNKISNELLVQNQFLEFTEFAQKIWEGNYSIDDFKFFCDTVSNSLIGRQLYKLQLLSAYHLAFSQNSCNFSVPGAGKTSIVYAAFAYLNSLKFDDSKYVNKLVIIGPPSSFKPWEDEYESCFFKRPKSLRINDSNISKIDKNNILKGIEGDNYNLILFSYNSVPNYLSELLSYFKINNNKIMLVCDEAHKIKNHVGVWSENILKLAPFAKSRVILTGTPCPNGYEDLYSLFKFIYPDKNVIQFKYQNLKSLTKNENQLLIKEMIDNIKPFFVRIKKSDLNLPPVTEHSNIYSQLNELEEEIYNRLIEALKNESDEIDKTSIFFRLFQASNNICLLNKPFIENDIEFYGSNLSAINLTNILGNSLIKRLNEIQLNYIPTKFIEVLKLVKELSNKGEKVIIWGLFIDSIKRLNDYLLSNGLNGNYIIGETPINDSPKLGNYIETRESILERFKNEPGVDFLISNPVVLGESISLHKSCHHAIYFEMSYSAAPYIQSRDRIHRVWLDSMNNQVVYPTNYYHIMNRHKLDEMCFLKVNNKFIKMIQVIEHEVPLFIEDLDSERNILIKEVLDEYKKNR